MIFKTIDKEKLGEYLDKISYVAYSDSFAKFAESVYASRRSFVGIFEENQLKAFFPVFEREGKHQHIAEVPFFIYTEVFFLDNGFIIDGLDFGRKLAKFLNCDVLRLNIYKLFFPENFTTGGFKEVFTALIIPLANVRSFEDYLKKSVSRNARSKIYKAQTIGFELVKLGENDLAEFYELYHRHVKYLNSAPHPVDYFRKILNTHNLGRNLFIFGARYQGRLISANLFALDKDYLEVKFLADDINERRLFPNNFLYAETIKWAITNGVKYIDLGGIPKTMCSNIEFKKSFGAEEYPIFTAYFFRNPWQKIIFKFNRRILYIKKYPKLILNKLIFKK